MVWGNNVVISNPDCYKGEPFSVALDAGAKLIVVDPRLTRVAARADVWLQLRPGTDTALALGMANVIVHEELYDREFVENYVHGWEPFVERVNEYPAGAGGGDHLGSPGEDRAGRPALRHDQAGGHPVGGGHRAAESPAPTTTGS